MTITLNDRLSELRSRIPDSGPVFWVDLEPLLRELAEALQIQVSVDGLDISKINGGFHLKPQS